MIWDSAAAWRAATMAKWVVRSVAMTMPESRCWRGSKSLTAAVRGEAEALGFAGGFGVGREGGDAAGPVEDGGAVKRRALGFAGGFRVGREGGDAAGPLKMAVRKAATLLPIGVMQPRPVTTTRFTSSPW